MMHEYLDHHTTSKPHERIIFSEVLKQWSDNKPEPVFFFGFHFRGFRVVPLSTVLYGWKPFYYLFVAISVAKLRRISYPSCNCYSFWPSKTKINKLDQRKNTSKVTKRLEIFNKLNSLKWNYSYLTCHLNTGRQEKK